MQSFCIISSNYTAQLFAWKGTPPDVKKYLGNRQIMGTVMAADEASAIAAWRAM